LARIVHAGYLTLIETEQPGLQMLAVSAELVLSLVSLLIAVLAAGIAGFQARRMRETWQAQNALEVARDLQSERQRTARSVLYNITAAKLPYEEWDRAQRGQVDDVVQQLNTAAYLTEKRLLPSKMLEENWNNLFRNAYVAAKPRIEARSQFGGIDMWVPFQRFAKQMLDKYGPPGTFYFERDDRDVE
jgi:type II secretory pathway pseudopilin PulG